MNDERHEELASLYALDLLGGAERQAFEALLEENRDLRRLVDDLRGAAASLAAAVPPVTPPPSLRAQVLASVERTEPIVDPTALAGANVIRPPAVVFQRMLPWGLAAGLAVLAGGLALRYNGARSEADLLRQERTLAAAGERLERLRLESDRILARRQIEDLGTQLAAAGDQLTEARTQLAEAQTRLTRRDVQVAALTERVDALTGASEYLGQQAFAANQRVAELQRALKAQGDLAELKITTLASMLGNSPEARAVAVWDTAKQQGVLQVDKLPALAANEDYQLWVVDPQYPNPVDGGVFSVEPASGVARVNFRANQPVRAVAAFAVTRERKGGVPKAEGPFVLLGK